MENVYKQLDRVINTIKDSDDYKKCIEIKNKMNNNTELVDMIERVKKLQKKIVNNPDSIDLENEYNELNNKLNDIPIYHEYLYYLDRVNEMIIYVKDSLNDYFVEIINEY
ncbi:MAG: YlbF family regulator [Bacilli bacterium]|nr:YlbF family regulator [Bacilli bacterium]